MSSSEDNKAVVRECYDRASNGDYDAFDDLLTEDYVLHPEEVRGKDELKAMVEGYRSALSGLRVTIDQQFAEGDHVATRITISGTHDGDFMGMPATGRDVSFSGIAISRCENGRIAEEWELVDTISLLGQVGALPALAQS